MKFQSHDSLDDEKLEGLYSQTVYDVLGHLLWFSWC